MFDLRFILFYFFLNYIQVTLYTIRYIHTRSDIGGYIIYMYKNTITYYICVSCTLHWGRSRHKKRRRRTEYTEIRAIGTAVQSVLAASPLKSVIAAARFETDQRS